MSTRAWQAAGACRSGSRTATRARSALLAAALSALAWTTGIAAAAPQFRLAVVNQHAERPDDAAERYGKLHHYLAQRLAHRGVQVGPLVIARSSEWLDKKVAAGEVDALIDGVIPSLQVEFATQAIEPALVVMRRGERHYRSVFFTRSDSPVRDLATLAGRTIAFESPHSTSAYHVPRIALREVGLSAVPASSSPNPREVRYVFAQSELNQAHWVFARRVDAAVFSDGDWNRTPENIRRELRVIHRTEPVIRWLLSFARRLDLPVRQAVLGVLLSAHEDPEGRSALARAERITRFEPLTREDRANLARWRRLLARQDGGKP